ncbi:TonB-linked outer membrane protein, SusC/RagA family [Fodinibius roseus]|uniref:TonB-linked outer membrane protein, SusC/RagA family n=1 Tax=Fodinibius roseus TaxID=1194090 RepID=A0A1M5GS80_9BACT|nr:SusC/RagA family TonB-linked outer membrane protein [Fodinibius roseus]SHG06576.1 TonB-linked outer membrane protein, SusC/RagA family [Fodinibius roseus]
MEWIIQKKRLASFSFLVLFLTFGAHVDLQAQTVSGTVLDASENEVMPGVNITVKGDPQTGTSTDSEGAFSLEVSSLNDTLEVSFIGFQTKDVPIGGRTTLEIVLQPQAIMGEDVVVTAFGVQRETRSLSYSTEGVDTESLTEARELNVMNSLQGKVAGLSISEGGAGVGSDSRVVLRGNRSISGNNEPLYVVDGVPIQGSYNEISPDNIASINVMKGPNAAALYGSDAQNGAIIIETKRGARNQIQVGLDNTVQFGQPIHSISVQNQYGQGVSGNYDPSSEESWGPPLDGRMVDHWSPDPELAGQQYAFEPQPDNITDFFETAINVSTSINASIGSENTTTSFSFTRTDASGMVPNNSLGRNNAALRVNSDLTDWLSLDAKIDYMNQDRKNPLSTGDGDNFNPFRNIYILPRNISHEQYQQYEYVAENGINHQHFWNPGSTTGKNPYWTMYRQLRLQDSERVLGMGSLTINFTENLSLLTRSSFDVSHNSQEQKVYYDSYGSAFSQGQYAVNKNDSRFFNADFLFTYENDLTDQWNVDLNVGGSVQKNIGEQYGSLSANTTQQLLVPNFFTLSNTQFPGASFSPDAPTETQSLYFSGRVGWNDALYLDITGRNDWSSTLPEESRSYFYPSVGLSAVISDLADLPDVVSFARVRGSYAEVGNSAPPYMLSRSANFSPGGQSGFLQVSGVLPAENLKPEQTESIEFGLDLRLFEDRFGLDVTYYKTNTFNQLFTIALPTGSGASSFFTNGGDVENRGMEMLLNTTPVQSRDFSWDLDLNYATNENIVNEISDERPRVVVGGDSYMRDFVVEQGEEFGNIYSRGFVRDDQGRVIVDSNGLPEITSGRTVKVANANPDWTGGLTNSFSYKNLTASFLIEHRQGGNVVSMTNSIMYGSGIAKETVKGRDGGLVFGDNLFAGETAVKEDGTPNDIEITAQNFWRNVGGRNTPVGEAFTQEATNTRLREVTIGYMLPLSVIETLPVSSIEVSVTGRNLFFIHRKGDWDPDILTSTGTAAVGYNAFTRPTQRTFGASLSIDF